MTSDRLAHGGIARAGARVDRLARRVHELHEAGDDDVELERLDEDRCVGEQAMGDATQRGIAGLPLDIGRRGDLTRDAPRAGEELRRTHRRDIRPVDVVFRRTRERERHAQRVGAVGRSSPANSTRLPFDFDIFAPSMMTMPWLSREVNGSVKLR